MQKDIIEILESQGLVIQDIDAIQLVPENNVEVYRILDSDRLFFLIQLNDIGNLDIDYFVNGLMDWITYEHSSEEGDMETVYQKYSMRKILWDLYVIFAVVLSDEKAGIPEEKVYEVQRDSRLMKRYIVQGISEKQIAEEIRFIVKTEEYMDHYIEKLEFNDNEEEQCKNMCSVEKYDTLDLLKIKTYQDVVTKLEEINGETFGDKKDENKRDRN